MTQAATVHLPETSVDAPSDPRRGTGGSLEGLLVLDGDRFVVAAYRALLGRDPDPGGLVSYLHRLKAGETKRGILTELGSSAEGRAYARRSVSLSGDELVPRVDPRSPRLPSMPDVSIEQRGQGVSSGTNPARTEGLTDHHTTQLASVTSDRSPVGRLVQLDDLLGLDGPEFLGRAYLTLLGRQIDPDGFRTYDARLRSGASKLSIVSELYNSPEGRNHNALIPALAARMARESFAAVSAKISARDLMRLDGIAFVDAAYQAVLGAPPSHQVRLRFAERLLSGTSKLETLLMMREERTSGEGPIGVTGLEPMLDEFREGLFPSARTLDELLDYEDTAFVDCAYKTVLRRAPDTSGLTHYRERLRSGESKISLIAELRASAEGKRVDMSLPGMSRAILLHRLANARFFGWVIASLLNVETNRPLERRIRAIDRRLRVMSLNDERERVEADSAVEQVSRLLRVITPKRTT